MRVSAQEDFIIVYSLLEHQYLGYLVEAHAVQLNSAGKPTLRFQSVSPENLPEFAAKADATDKKLVQLCDEMRQERIVRRFAGKKLAPADFFLKHFTGEKNPSQLPALIHAHIDQIRDEVFELLPSKPFYVMGQDGNPAWQPVVFAEEKPTIRFHFFRNEEDTHYYPTLRYQGRKLEFYHKDVAVLTNRPARLLLEGTLYTLDGNADGKKLLPFLKRKFISVPRKMEGQYYKSFVAPLIETEDVIAHGFEIAQIRSEPTFALCLTAAPETPNDLFKDEQTASTTLLRLDSPALLRAEARYEGHTVPLARRADCMVLSDEAGDTYRFTKVHRDLPAELAFLSSLSQSGLESITDRAQANLPLGQALAWLREHAETLREAGIELRQAMPEGARFALATPRLELEAKARMDWFELGGEVVIGAIRIPFRLLRQALARHQHWITLPTGELLPIPEDWVEALQDLGIAAGNKNLESDTLELRPAQLAMLGPLLQDSGISTQVPIEWQERLRSLAAPASFPLPGSFKGTLRPYQQAGYDWLQTLRAAKLGACLADDMGLGKTIQTLALLCALHPPDETPRKTSLLVVPNSLLYNWEREAKTFAPHLRILRHIGPQRHRRTDHFSYYHLILTSYGTLRSDKALFNGYPFEAVVLDEAHAIKNHDSATAKAVFGLTGGFRLSLTGTPIENNLMELWSQMQFCNAGLLGTATSFRQQFVNPIERQGDAAKAERLRKMISPFLLRRLKQQVAQDLPEKSVQTLYCELTEEQRHAYERVRSAYRSTILEKLEEGQLAQNRFLVLRGLTHLRQIACHPALTEPDYAAGSGKFESLCYKLQEVLEEGHKVLVFSQFVRHLHLLKAWLDEHRISYAYLDGQTKDRPAQVDRFEKNPDVQVFLLSLKAGGVGLNLTSADYVFVLDPWWNPAAEAQAIDRAHRIGQTKPVFVYKFITRETVEERILELQDRKAALAGALIQAEDTFLRQLSEDDIRALFG